MELAGDLLAADEDEWFVWTEWYEARLRGDPPDIVLEERRALDLTEDDWDQGPAHVNALIAKMIEERRAELRMTAGPKGSIDGLLDGAALRLSIADWSLDHIHNFMVLVPFPGDVRDDLDDAVAASLAEQLASLAKALGELAEDIEDEQHNARWAARLIKDLNRAAAEADESKKPVIPGEIVRYGRNLEQNRLDPVVNGALPRVLFQRLEGVVEQHNAIARLFLTGALARFEPLNTTPIPADIPADQVCDWVIGAIDMVVDEDWANTPQPGPHEKTALRDMRRSLRDLQKELNEERDATADPRRVEELNAAIRREGAISAATVLRFAIKSGRAAKEGVAVAADLQTLWPRRVTEAVDALWKLIGNVQ
ncbi:MAG: hypothetical protein AAF899_05625 [Pseudomonadota bacterium]